VITKEVQGLKKLVNEFSKFARMPEPNPKPEDIHEVIEEVLNLYKDNRKKARILTEYESTVTLINIDKEQIKRVFINLIENALDAIQNGNGLITFKTYFDNSKEMINISVADTGSGVARNYREKLFMPYFSTKKKGTGLGLAIANRIIADHNGGIYIEDNEDQGTKFIISLPV